MRRGICAVALCASVGLTGCGALGGGTPALDTHVLTAPQPQAASRTRTLQVLVSEPKALKLYDTQNIAVRTGATTVEYLGGAQWGDTLPKTVQSALAEALQDAGFASGVGVPGQGLAIDYQLITEIREFAVQTAGADQAVVRIYAQLLNDRTGNVIARETFEASVPVTSESGFVAGLNRAFGAVAGDIVRWTAGRV